MVEQTNGRANWGQTIVLLSAASGAAASVVGIVAAWWALAGETPVFVFAHLETLQAWRHGGIYSGVPLEFWTLVGFLGVAALAIQLPSRCPKVWTWSLLVSTVCLTGLVGGHVWSAGFGSWPLVVMTVAAVGAMAGTSVAFDRELHGVTSQRRSAVGFGVVLLALAFLAIGGMTMRAHLQTISPRAAAEANFIRWFDDARSRTSSSTNSVLVVEVLNDYQCQFCAAAVPRLAELIEAVRSDVSRDVRLVLTDFPLDSSCNPALASAPHSAACEAAALARFSEQSMTPEDHAQTAQWLFQQGPELSQDDIRAYLDDRGMTSAFNELRDELLAGVSADVASGLRRGVRTTPTVFIDGVRLPHHVYAELALRSLANTR